MWLRISPEMDFSLEMELQGVNEKTREHGVERFDKAVCKEFVERLKKAFPEEDVRTSHFDFGSPWEKHLKTA